VELLDKRIADGRTYISISEKMGDIIYVHASYVCYENLIRYFIEDTLSDSNEVLLEGIIIYDETGFLPVIRIIILKSLKIGHIT